MISKFLNNYYKTNNNITEAFDSDTVALEYDNLDITLFGVKRAADDWDEREIKVSWTYEADKEAVECEIFDLMTDEDLPGIYDMETADIYNYIRKNFDDLFDKYYEELHEIFRDAAIDDAQENYEYDPYDIYADLMPEYNGDLDH